MTMLANVSERNDVMAPEPRPKKTYAAPHYRMLGANTAKVLLERKALPGDPGAKEMLEIIHNSNTQQWSCNLKSGNIPRRKL